LRFVGRVLRRFSKNNGPILASAIAFDALMSLVPLLALISVVLSHLVDPEQAEELLATQLEMLLPGAADRVIQAYSAIIERGIAAGAIGLLGLVIFGAMAFRTIRSALWVIFSGVDAETRRPTHLSRLAPFAYVALSTIGLLAGSLFMTALDAIPRSGVELGEFRLALGFGARTVGRIVCFFGLAALLASFYRLLPPSPPSRGLAAMGGLLAGTVWEIVRRLMVWYFAHLSLVGAYYGSLASAVVLLIGLNAAALVLLAGGQTIAELERCRRAGVPWYRDPGKDLKLVQPGGQ
jgi:YihY family inner membrane protein